MTPVYRISIFNYVVKLQTKQIDNDVLVDEILLPTVLSTKL